MAPIVDTTPARDPVRTRDADKIEAAINQIPPPLVIDAISATNGRLSAVLKFATSSEAEFIYSPIEMRRQSPAKVANEFRLTNVDVTEPI